MNKNLFNNWIVCNYSKIRERLSLQGNLDDDNLQDAYLLTFGARGDVAYSDYLRLFLRNYRNERKKTVAHSFLYVYPDPLFFEFLHEDEAQEEERRQKTLPSLNCVMRYVKATNNADDVQIFSYYMLQGLPYSTIADYTGCSRTAVRKKIDVIKQDIQHYFSKAI